VGSSGGKRRKTVRRPRAAQGPVVRGHETENWFLTAPENVVNLRPARVGVSPILSGRWPDTSSLRWLGFGIVVALSHLKWRRRSR
jgi:hypothetical protein